MNLIIDAGNTYIKIAVFKESLLLYRTSIKSADLSKISYVLNQFSDIRFAIISSVSSVRLKELSPFLRELEVIELTVDLPLPFQINYKTPQTLGVDRIALVAAAHKKYKHRNCLVIDAGSCITYDFIDEKEVYQGGIIGLGLRMRYKSLNEYTARLPLLEPKMENNLIGKSTNSAMHNGVSLAMIVEINGIIDEFSNTYKDLVVILTGGDAHFLSKRLKSGIFAHSNFLIQGLNYILEYNRYR